MASLVQLLNEFDKDRLDGWVLAQELAHLIAGIRNILFGLRGQGLAAVVTEFCGGGVDLAAVGTLSGFDLGVRRFDGDLESGATQEDSINIV